MEVIPVSDAVGAAVHGVDVRTLTDEQTAMLDHAWAEHGVLFFRDQDLSPDEHITFAERFAPIEVNRFFATVDGHPRIAEVRKEPTDEANIGGGWHTDHSYDSAPARGSILVARDVPGTGGDTRYLGTAAAYDALSDGLKETLNGLRAEHSNRHVFGAAATRRQKVAGRIGNPAGVSDAEHPVIVKHPQTGRRLLYINPAFTRRFVGWTHDESLPLLTFLYEHMTQEQFTYQFDWQPGSIAMWDNRSTWHWALNDYPGERRLMHRITIQGERLEAAS